MSDTIEILTIGMGAIGTLYSYVLSQNHNVRITAVARSSYDAISKGVTIESEKFGLIEGWKPDRVVKSADEANDRAYQFIVVATKCVPDLLPTSSILAPYLESEFAERVKPTVVLIQNGIGIEHPVQQAYSDVPIISVVAWVGTNLLANGVVTHGMLEKLIIGLYKGEGVGTEVNPISGETGDSYADPAGYKQEGGPEREAEGVRRTNQFADLLRGGGGGVEVAEDIQPQRYAKLIWNAAWSSMCALSRSTVSAIVAPDVLPFTLPVVRRTMLEVLYVARSWGYSEEVLPMKAVDSAISVTIRNYQRAASGQNTPGTPGVRSDAFGSQGYGFPTSEATAIESTVNFKPSLLIDIEKGAPCELEVLIGALLDRARARGVATPRLDLVYSAIKPLQDAAVRKYAEDETHKQHIADWLRRRPAVAGAGLEGRKAWERALRASEKAGAERVKVQMARGVPKVAGTAVAQEEADENNQEIKKLARFD